MRRVFNSSFSVIPQTILFATAALAICFCAALAQSPNDADDLAERGTGLIRERPEDLRRFESVPRFRSFLPAERDLSPLMPPPGDQGKQGSCVGWAVAYAARSYHYAADHGVSAAQSRNMASPAALYAAVKDPHRDCKSGIRITDALQYLKKFGVPSIAEFPYDADQCQRALSSEDRVRSSRFQIVDWRLIDVRRHDDIKGQISRGHPVVIGTTPDHDFMRRRGGMYTNAQTDESQSHAMAVVGYSDQRQAFKIINSWGIKWGENGFRWISYPAFAAITKYGFVMETDGRVDPRPAPVPDVPQPPHPIATPVPVPGPQPVPDTFVPPHLLGLPLKVRSILETVACAGLSRFDRSARIATAYAGASDALGDLNARLSAAIPGYTIATEHRPWPQCEALQTFAEPLAEPMGLSLKIVGANAVVPSLKNGDPLLIEVGTPSFPSYLYLIYFQASGEAVHLVQPQGLIGQQHNPRSSLVLGDGRDGGPRFTISQPFGPEMIVAVASASPLFETTQPFSATEREFLTEYRRAMLIRAPGKAARRVSAVSISLVTTQ